MPSPAGSRSGSRSAAGSTIRCWSARSAKGRLPLFLAGLSLRTGLDLPALWELLPDAAGRGRGDRPSRRRGSDARPRPRSCSPSPAARRHVAAQLDLYDMLDPAEARRRVLLWRLDPAYRAAVARLAS